MDKGTCVLDTEEIECTASEDIADTFSLTLVSTLITKEIDDDTDYELTAALITLTIYGNWAGDETVASGQNVVASELDFNDNAITI